MNIASSTAPRCQGTSRILKPNTIIRMFSGVSILFLQNYLILNTKDYFPSAVTVTNVDKTLAFWRSCKFREGLYFLFLSKILINSASLYYSLVGFDTEEPHTD